MKISKRFKSVSFKALTAGTLFSFYLFKFKKPVFMSVPEEESEKDDFNMFDEPDSDFGQDEEIMEAFKNPNITEQEKNFLKKQMKLQSIQPLPFSKLHAIFKTGVDEEKWNGIRGVLDYTPNQLSKFEFSLNLDGTKSLKNHKISTMCMVPFHEKSQEGAFLIGRKDGDQSLGLQCHVNLGESDKILLISSHPKPNINEGHYVIEYSHEFERCNAAIKVSNMETSVSMTAALYKNIFLGFEGVKHVFNKLFTN
jgi:hypothetical protein